MDGFWKTEGLHWVLYLSALYAVGAGVEMLVLLHRRSAWPVVLLVMACTFVGMTTFFAVVVWAKVRRNAR